MSNLIVVSNRKDWPFETPGVEVVDARSYLIDPEFADRRGIRLFNLCRSYKYQSSGYYVTLLATARGHRPLPTVTTIQDLKSPATVRFVSEELEELIQTTLKPVHFREFTLSVYFGHNVSPRYEDLSQHLFDLIQAPLLRATFVRFNGKWLLRSANPMPLGDIPRQHRAFVVHKAGEYFSERRSALNRPLAKYDLAILTNPAEPEPPSNPAALQAFIREGEALGLRCQIIGRRELTRYAEFDALFLRETTQVDHYTYQFARRAARDGLVVIDDPESILKCSNKVYLAELLSRNRISTPQTRIVHRDNVAEVAATLGWPCVLKKPDAAFSLGVVKVEDPVGWTEKVEEFLESSDLVIAQEFLPTPFDWRVGVCDGEALFASKYHMASEHWQIIRRDGRGRQCGKVETVPLSKAPRQVIQTAVRAANLVGDGLYGVDLKQVNGHVYVIEINDNPNIDAGNEDQVLKEELYRRILQLFLKRLDRQKRTAASAARSIAGH